MDKEKLIGELLEGGHLRTSAVIDAFMRVPRERFMMDNYKESAYVDLPFPIMAGQSISQPSTVSIMTEALDVKEGQKNSGSRGRKRIPGGSIVRTRRPYRPGHYNGNNS